MLYTGHGDAGYTSVLGGPALLKCHDRLEALGTIDEAQAQLGLARALLPGQWGARLLRVQNDLRLLMADVALAPGCDCATGFLGADQLAALESDLTAWEDCTGGFHGFTTPGDSLPTAHLHLARTVIRRAERQVVSLAQTGEIGNPLLLTYLNRLSSWVYALALLVETPPDLAPSHAA